MGIRSIKILLTSAAASLTAACATTGSAPQPGIHPDTCAMTTVVGSSVNPTNENLGNCINNRGERIDVLTQRNIEMMRIGAAADVATQIIAANDPADEPRREFIARGVLYQLMTGQVSEDPDAFLANYNLTLEELQAIAGDMTPSRVHAVVPYIRMLETDLNRFEALIENGEGRAAREALSNAFGRLGGLDPVLLQDILDMSNSVLGHDLEQLGRDHLFGYSPFSQVENVTAAGPAQQ